MIQIIFNNKMSGSIFQMLVIVLEDLKTAMTTTRLLTSIFYYNGLWQVLILAGSEKKLVLPIVVLGFPSVGFH